MIQRQDEQRMNDDEKQDSTHTESVAEEGKEKLSCMLMFLIAFK